MVLKRSLAGLLALVFLPMLACSKTQDTAPEQRLFGTPAVIQSVNFNVGEERLQCDLTEYARVHFCESFGFDITLSPNLLDMEGTYTQMDLEVKVVDPDSTPAKNDILLVAASYILDKNEDSLVLFDDGSQNKFPFTQQGQDNLDCKVDNGTCHCDPAQFELNSNDAVAGDGTYTRKFAFFNLQGKFRDLMTNCVAKVKGQAPKGFAAGTTLNFRIDVVDRSGNLTTWPQKPSLTVQPNTMTCDTPGNDLCVCCFLRSNDPQSDPPNGCRGLDGMLGPPGSIYETGVCHNI